MPEDSEKKENAFASFASGLVDVEKEDEKAKKEILKEGIEKIEKDDKKSILSSRMITSKISKMREYTDMSAFVGTSGKIKSPRFKRSEFISLLARELLLIGNEELNDKGGIISLKKLEEYFAEKRDNWELRENDITEAIRFLEKEKMIPSFEKLDKNLELIYFKPVELSNDTRKILMVAHGIEASKKTIKDVLGWSEERVSNGIKQLVSNGLAIEEGEYIFFPGLE